MEDGSFPENTASVWVRNVSSEISYIKVVAEAGKMEEMIPYTTRVVAQGESTVYVIMIL